MINARPWYGSQAEQTRGLLGQQENVLLNEIQDLGSDAVMLTQDAGDDVHLAFRLFVERQLGARPPSPAALLATNAGPLIIMVLTVLKSCFARPCRHRPPGDKPVARVHSE